MKREVVQTIPSASGQFKVEIIRRPTGAFQVELYRWNEEWIEDHKVAEFWWDIGGLTLTDTLERAEKLAQEKLAVCEPPAENE
jgi:hypothetical protein